MAKKKKGEHLKQYEFKPGESGNPNGRPKKIYTILQKKGYSKDDIRTAFSEIAWYTLEEAKELQDDETKPVITRIVCKQFLEAFNKGDWNRIKEILEHSIGRPKQDIGITTNPEIKPTKFIDATGVRGSK